MNWRQKTCVVANLLLKRLNRELAYVSFPRNRFVWLSPDTTTEWALNKPSNPRRVWELPL